MKNIKKPRKAFRKKPKQTPVKVSHAEQHVELVHLLSDDNFIDKMTERLLGTKDDDFLDSLNLLDEHLSTLTEGESMHGLAQVMNACAKAKNKLKYHLNSSADEASKAKILIDCIDSHNKNIDLKIKLVNSIVDYANNYVVASALNKVKCSSLLEGDLATVISLAKRMPNQRTFADSVFSMVSNKLKIDANKEHLHRKALKPQRVKKFTSKIISKLKNKFHPQDKLQRKATNFQNANDFIKTKISKLADLQLLQDRGDFLVPDVGQQSRSLTGVVDSTPSTPERTAIDQEKECLVNKIIGVARRTYHNALHYREFVTELQKLDSCINKGKEYILDILMRVGDVLSEDKKSSEPSRTSVIDNLSDILAEYTDVVLNQPEQTSDRQRSRRITRSKSESALNTGVEKRSRSLSTTRNHSPHAKLDTVVTNITSEIMEKVYDSKVLQDDFDHFLDKEIVQITLQCLEGRDTFGSQFILRSLSEKLEANVKGIKSDDTKSRKKATAALNFFKTNLGFEPKSLNPTVEVKPVTRQMPATIYSETRKDSSRDGLQHQKDVARLKPAELSAGSQVGFPLFTSHSQVPLPAPARMIQDMSQTRSSVACAQEAQRAYYNRDRIGQISTTNTWGAPLVC